MLCPFLISYLGILGAFSMDMHVKYQNRYMCVLKGSSVDLHCTFKAPGGLVVSKAFWTTVPVQNMEAPNLSYESQYRGRVQYLGDKFQYCTLRLNNVRREDEHKAYYFMFTKGIKKWLGQPGVSLKVTELRVYIPERVLETEEVAVTCQTSCSLTYSAIIWYKNGRPLSTKRTENNRLLLQSVSSEDAGSYSCAVRGYEHLPSPAETLTVTYSPKTVSVSISPSGKVMEGSSVILTCSSDANPPVESYTWFREGGSTSVGSGQSYSISSISSAHKGNYRCEALNRHGSAHSEYKSLDVLYLPKTVSVSISPSGEVVEGSSVTLICSSDANPPVHSYTWFTEGGTSPVGSGKSYNITNISSADKGKYRCGAVNDHGSGYSEYMLLDVLYPPKKVSVSISPSGELVKGSSVTLTCCSDANPPVQSYTWFKGTALIHKGETYVIPNVSSEDRGGYTCQSWNEYGERNSTVVHFNVVYPPRNISVSISQSGETVEGSSVTLTCSSDANPPVVNYTWFKEGETSPVGSGQSYNFNFSSSTRGSYYCVAQNVHGSQGSAAVTVTLKVSHHMMLYITVGVTLCGAGVILTMFFCMSRRKCQNKKTHKRDSQNVDPKAKDDTYTALSLTPRASDDVYQTLKFVQPSAVDDIKVRMSKSLGPPSMPHVYENPAKVKYEHWNRHHLDQANFAQKFDTEHVHY